LRAFHRAAFALAKGSPATTETAMKTPALALICAALVLT